MIYISKIELNPRSRQVQSELRNPYQMHRTLSKAFGEEAHWKEARCLFRVEEGPNVNRPRVLMQSRMRPEWQRLTVAPEYLPLPPETKAFAPQFVTGQGLAFRLRTNPTIKREGKRLGLYREEEQREWLYRKAESGGFRICSVITRADERLAFRTTAGCEATFSAVTFDGTLLISDPETFLKTLEAGIGSGKAFGFGLLSLARAA